MAKRTGGLGRDFFSILDDNLTAENAKGSTTSLKLSVIEPRKGQPRKDFDKDALENLAESIGTYGVLQPILVRENPKAEGYYEIIAGERRWRAARMAGLSEIPAIIMDGDELKTAQISLIENIQREDLNAVEEALAYFELIETFGATHEQIAKAVGKSRTAITNSMRLLDLPEEVLDLLRKGDLTAGHARALLGLDDKNDIAPTAEKVVEKGISVRETEALVKKINSAPKYKKKEGYVGSLEQQRAYYLRDLETRTSELLGVKVRIQDIGRKKSITLSYADDMELEGIIERLCGGREAFEEISGEISDKLMK